jgi:hypothetical protein
LPSRTISDPTDDLSPVRRIDFDFAPDMRFVWVNLRHTKTIQYGQRTLRVPLPAIPGSMLCPVTALSRLFGMVDASPGHLAFTYLTSTGKLESFTNKTFIACLKAELAACTELERPPERRDHQSPKVTRLTSSRPRMAQSYTNAN